MAKIKTLKIDDYEFKNNVVFNTTQGWDEQTTLISEEGMIYVYTDYRVNGDGENIPGFKVGDGLAYLIDVPFNDDLLGALAFKDSATGSCTPLGTVSQPTFTGDEITLSGSITPTGSIAITEGSGTSNYTPAGTVSAPAITVTPTSATVNSITDVGALPAFSATVSGENLTFSWTAGSLPTKGSDTSVMTGATATSEAPMFTGTATELAATFTGTASSFSGTATPTGTVSQPTFTGSSTQVTVS